MDLKPDGAFERAWKLTCNKHHLKRLFFRPCPLCVEEKRLEFIIKAKESLLDSVMNIIAITHDKEILAEATAILSTAKSLTALTRDDTEGAK